MVDCEGCTSRLIIDVAGDKITLTLTCMDAGYETKKTVSCSDIQGLEDLITEFNTARTYLLENN